MSHEGREDASGFAGWPAAVVMAGLLAVLLVPAPLLTQLHFNYATPNGAVWEKVHPGTDAVLLGCAAAACRSGRPGTWLIERLRRFPGATALLAVNAFLLVYLIAVLREPFTPLIDTFVLPVAVLLAVTDLPPVWRARIEAALHLYVAGNALLGIAEFVTGWRLIPAEIDGVAQTSEVEARAFGLLGHPLSSASMAGLYAVVLMCGGGRRLPAGWRTPALGLQFLALGAFGGRTALVMTVVAAVLRACLGLGRLLAGRPVDLRVVAWGFLLAPVMLAGAGAVALSGFFDTVLDRFVDDKGSAASRHAIFELFGWLSWPELLLGPDPDRLASLLHLVGIEVGVESFWLGFILTLGLLPALVFFAGYLLFIADVMRRCSAAAWAPLLFFTGIISTAITLSSKSTELAQFVAVVTVLMPRAAVPVPRRRAVPNLVPALP